jgi:hypothetical protein
MTGSTTPASAYEVGVPHEPHQLEQISSLLYDGRIDITIRTIMIELSTNRSVARSILDELASRCGGGGVGGSTGGCDYRIIRMMASSPSRGMGGDATVGGKEEGSDNARCMVLSTGIGGGKGGGDGGVGTVFMISHVSPPVGNEYDDECGNSVRGRYRDNDANVTSAAHERALSMQRDMLSSTTSTIRDVFVDPSILPAPELCGDGDASRGTLWHQAGGGRGICPISAASSRTSSSSSSSSSSAAAIAGGGSKISVGGRPTTAAAFFGASSQGVGGVGGKRAANKARASDSVKIITTTMTTEKENDANDSRRRDDEQAPLPSLPTSTSNDGRVSSSSFLKTTMAMVTASKTKTMKNGTGNADDFAGDVDEDDDFIKDETARRARLAKEARRSKINDDGVKSDTGGGVSGGQRRKVAPEKRRNGRAKMEKMKDADLGDDEEMMASNDARGGGGGDENGERGVTEYDDVIEAKTEEKKMKAPPPVDAGAMDVFAKKTVQLAEYDASTSTTTLSVRAGGSRGEGGSKKRRKKLVERTTIDNNGYMCTETLTVWEDVEEEEDGIMDMELAARTNVVAGSAKGGPDKSMGAASKMMMTGENRCITSCGKVGVGKQKKQAGLMGFFGKKK